MASQVNDLAQRIMSISWGASDDRDYSRAYLMREYLRRMAWWAKALNLSAGYPFFDVAAAIDPAVRADQVVVDRVTADLRKNLQSVVATRVCVNALHFAALLDAEVPLPSVPDMPYEPVIMLLERGEGFYAEGGGLIDIGLIGVPIGKIEDNLLTEPLVELDEDVLDALDVQRRHSD
jgi:hypothetical protein